MELEQRKQPVHIAHATIGKSLGGPNTCAWIFLNFSTTTDVVVDVVMEALLNLWVYPTPEPIHGSEYARCELEVLLRKISH